MAKTKTKVVKEPQVVVEESQVVKQPKVEVKKTSAPKWEIKDRVYRLKGKKRPVVYIMRSRGLFWFDEEKGYEREMKYCRNQKTVFIDEMSGPQRLGHIIFRDGFLKVPKNMQNLQKLLSIYHPLKDRIYEEYSAVEEAKDDLEELDLQIDALNAARSIDIDHAEAILRVEKGSEVNNMSSKEIKRDLLLFAKNNASMFISLANDDNVQLRNFAIKAREAGIINLSSDQRTFTWGTNNRKLMNVPFDENPYSAFAAFLKTDEGVEIYKSIDKKL